MDRLEVSVKSHPARKDVMIIAPKGVIDTLSVDDFETSVKRLVALKRHHLLIDLKDVTYISSVGWGVILGNIKGVRSARHQIHLVGMSPVVRDIYNQLGLEQIIKAHPCIETATRTISE